MPTYNEEKTVGLCSAVLSVHSAVSEVIVIANNCTDDTVKVATENGARIIETEVKGKGHALKLGVMKAKEEFVVFYDSDVTNPSAVTIQQLLSGFTSDNIVLVKGEFDRSDHPGPVTDMLVKPTLRSVNHPAQEIKQPLSGFVAAKTSFLKLITFPDDFGVDLAILLSVYKHGFGVAEVLLSDINHKQRPWSHYINMANEVALVFKKFNIIQGG
jgi:glycosyltransferase involved in cell wall biosynthesis